MLLGLDAWADYPIWIDKSCERDACEVSVKILTLEDRAEFILSESIAIKDSRPMPLRRINGFTNWTVDYRDGFSLLKFKAAPSNLQIKVRFKNAGGTPLSQTTYAFSGSSSGFIESRAFTYQSFQVGLGAGIAYNSFSQNDGENIVSYSSLASPTYYGELSYQRNKHRIAIGSKNTPGQIKSNEFSSNYTWQKEFIVIL